MEDASRRSRVGGAAVDKPASGWMKNRSEIAPSFSKSVISGASEPEKKQSNNRFCTTKWRAELSPRAVSGRTQDLSVLTLGR
jgi:hypothetical protein